MTHDEPHLVPAWVGAQRKRQPRCGCTCDECLAPNGDDCICLECSCTKAAGVADG